MRLPASAVTELQIQHRLKHITHAAIHLLIMALLSYSFQGCVGRTAKCAAV